VVWEDAFAPKAAGQQEYARESCLTGSGLIALDRNDRRVLSIVRLASEIANAHVVICARKVDHALITSDPLDLRRLEPIDSFMIGL